MVETLKMIKTFMFPTDLSLIKYENAKEIRKKYTQVQNWDSSLCFSFSKKEHRNFLKFCVACNVRVKTRSTSYKRLASTPTGPICSGFD